jgi:ABC-type sugar transport system ATPase subunit
MLQRKPLNFPAASSSAALLARALVKNAGLVLLDEPLANLDYKLREELRIEMPKIFERVRGDLSSMRPPSRRKRFFWAATPRH